MWEESVSEIPAPSRRSSHQTEISVPRGMVVSHDQFDAPSSGVVCATASRTTGTLTKTSRETPPSSTKRQSARWSACQRPANDGAADPRKRHSGTRRQLLPLRTRSRSARTASRRGCSWAIASVGELPTLLADGGRSRSSASGRGFRGPPPGVCWNRLLPLAWIVGGRLFTNSPVAGWSVSGVGRRVEILVHQDWWTMGGALLGVVPAGGGARRARSLG